MIFMSSQAESPEHLLLLCLFIGSMVHLNDYTLDEMDDLLICGKCSEKLEWSVDTKGDQMHLEDCFCASLGYLEA